MALPSACSGAMYIGVPATTPDCVRLASSAVRARPKSVSLACGSPPFSRRMLPGLMSRWISPWACAAAKPRVSCTATCNISGVSSGPVAAIFLQGAAGDVLHDQVGDRLLLDGVDLHDVLVADPGGRAGLAEEPLAGGWSGRQLGGHHLDGNDAVQGLVEGAEHGAEAPLAQYLQYLVV